MSTIKRNECKGTFDKDTILASLASNDPIPRRTAFIEISKQNELDAETISTVIRQMNCGDSELLPHAAIAICKLQIDGTAALPSLISVLSKKDIVGNAKYWSIQSPTFDRPGPRTAPEMIKTGSDIEGIVRSAAAIAVSRLGPNAAAAVDVLIKSLKDRSSLVRGNAAFALGKIGPRAMAAVPSLIRALDDAEEGVYGDVCTALIEIRAALPQMVLPLFQRCVADGLEGATYDTLLSLDSFAVASCLAEQLRHRDKSTRCAARILAEEKLGGLKAVLLPQLLLALGDTDQWVRYHITIALRRIELVAVHDVVAILSQQITRDQDEQCVMAAIDSLGVLGRHTPAAVSALSEALIRVTHWKAQIYVTDWKVRHLIAQILGELGPKAEIAIPSLVRALKDRDYLVQAEAARTLGKIRRSNQQIEEGLIARAIDKDEHWDVRYEAAVAIVATGCCVKEIVPVLTSALSDENLGVRSRAVKALWWLGTNAIDAIPALLLALQDKDGGVRKGACEALCRIGGSAGRVLLQTLPSLEIVLKCRVIFALGSMKEIGQEAIPALIELLREDDRSIQCAAAIALGEYGALAIPAVPHLCRLLQVDSRDVRCRAAFALEKIGPPAVDALPTLHEVLQDRDEWVRTCVKSAVGAISGSSEMDELSPEDRRTVAWFDSLKVGDFLTRMQLFWCIGKLEYSALMACDRAWGGSKRGKRLIKLKNGGKLPRTFLHSEHAIAKAFEVLASVFNQSPFVPDAWTKAEHMPDLQEIRMRGERPDPWWTPRGRRAWTYVDRYLAVKGLRPKLILDQDDSPDG